MKKISRSRPSGRAGEGKRSQSLKRLSKDVVTPSPAPLFSQRKSLAWRAFKRTFPNTAAMKGTLEVFERAYILGWIDARK